MIVRGAREFRKYRGQFKSGDVYIGLVSPKTLRRDILIDFLEQGVHCLPSPLSQNLNSSKVAQALVLGAYMLEHTRIISRRQDLIEAVNLYNRNHIHAVVSKENQLHCGHGIRKWDHIETLYSFLGLESSSYPFILQPFIQNFLDIRVIIAGEYVEAYRRMNPDNFRMNISSGGQSSPHELTKAQTQFCRKIMNRGKFPFAHLDLHILENGTCFLSEIALNGGIKGAGISRSDLEQKKRDVLEKLAEKAHGR